MADITVATYTCSTREYADSILAVIDPSFSIKHRFYREDCVYDEKNKVHLKDLKFL